MCNSCNCDGYDQCSIVGHLPVGFCCSNCYLYNEAHTCLKTKSKPKITVGASSGDEEEGHIEPISTSIEGGLLKVEIMKDGKKIPIIIDIHQHLE